MFDDDDNDFKSHDEIEKLPIYRKGSEIFDTIKDITDLISDDDPHLSEIKGFLLQDSMMICAKIAGAEGVGLYDIKMENAAIIRKCARDLMVQYHSLKMFGFEHAEYYKMVRQQIEEFRFLFIDWVAGFDPWNYIVDEWGLFNPPGVGPFDKDPLDM